MSEGSVVTDDPGDGNNQEGKHRRKPRKAVAPSCSPPAIAWPTQQHRQYSQDNRTGKGSDPIKQAEADPGPDAGSILQMQRDQKERGYEKREQTVVPRRVC